MDEIQAGLRYLFQTSSNYTLLASGTGHAGMEMAVANLLEPGDTVLVGVNGIWGERVADMAERFGAKVVALHTEAGEAAGDTSWRSFVCTVGLLRDVRHRLEVLHLWCSGAGCGGGLGPRAAAV